MRSEPADHGLGRSGGGLTTNVRALLAGVVSAVALGLSTAMVYPALIAVVSDHAHPTSRWGRRANALGTYRFWRDIGYAAGALVAGLLAYTLGLNVTIIAAAVLPGGSGLLAARWITERHTSATSHTIAKLRWHPPGPAIVAHRQRGELP
ncbi:hypothetical protein [Actinomadura sp. NPDC049753]|uniref:hypothetical protein n=1 Tax=Actinomadura sp. NPDC049753 TaxID=3154739 RepID=UPI0034322C85